MFKAESLIITLPSQSQARRGADLCALQTGSCRWLSCRGINQELIEPSEWKPVNDCLKEVQVIKAEDMLCHGLMRPGLMA